MIEFSAILPLYIYLGLMAILLIISIGHVFHAVRFGGLQIISIFSSGLFIAGLVVIAWLSRDLMIDVDWSGTFRIDFPSLAGLTF